MVVAEGVAELVVFGGFALLDLAFDVRLRGDVKDVAPGAVEVRRTDAAVERRLRRVFTRAAVVTGAGTAGAVGGVLTLGPGEGGRAQTNGTLAARDAGAAITAVEAAAHLRVIVTRGSSKALKKCCCFF